MECFPAETSEDDITLSQFLNTIESEIQLTDVNPEEIFSEFIDHGPDPGPFNCNDMCDLGTFELANVDFLMDYPDISSGPVGPKNMDDLPINTKDTALNVPLEVSRII